MCRIKELIKGTNTTSPRDAMPFAPVVVGSVQLVVPIPREGRLRQLQPGDVLGADDYHNLCAIRQSRVRRQLHDIPSDYSVVRHSHPVFPHPFDFTEMLSMYTRNMLWSAKPKSP